MHLGIWRCQLLGFFRRQSESLPRGQRAIHVCVCVACSFPASGCTLHAITVLVTDYSPLFQADGVVMPCCYVLLVGGKRIWILNGGYGVTSTSEKIGRNPLTGSELLIVNARSKLHSMLAKLPKPDL